VKVQGPGPDSVWAAVDPDLVDRVIWNLLDNALKFTPPGGRVKADVRSSGGAVVVEVADSGPGIPLDQLEAVFDRFHRIDEARTPGVEASGAGLGLAIVKAISNLHGGSVTASNQSGGGAVFRVSLPQGRGSSGAATDRRDHQS
jgi:signal transduction histidine kinase